MRFLFHCRNTTGLGHLMRSGNIARALHELLPDAEILFTGNRGSVAPLFLEFAYHPHLGTKSILALRPDVIIVDTLFPNWTIPESIPIVYVMRKIKSSTLHHFLAHPLAARTDVVVIPHTQEEFSSGLPSWMQQKACWVGPIVRTPNSSVQQQLRKKYEIRPSDFVVTSTAGGGGKTEESKLFFDIITAVHNPLREMIPDLRHFIVRGPYSDVPVVPHPRATVLSLEPQLNDLMALSNVVIAEGGYNTVHEIRLAKVPAIFIPSNRKHDNQEERVRKLETAGMCAVFTERSPQVAADGILRIFQSPTRLQEMKTNLQKDRMQTGNLAAAKKILELARGFTAQGPEYAGRQ